MDTAVDMSASCSPSQATENDDDIQRNSKDIYNVQITIYYRCEIEDFVETRLCKLCVLLGSRHIRISAN